MAKRRSEKQHHLLIERLLSRIKGDVHPNFDEAYLQIDHPDYRFLPAPQGIPSPKTGILQIPDLLYDDDGYLLLFEVETADSIEDPHTKEQWDTFSSYMIEREGDFIIAVPLGCSYLAERRISQLSIKADVWEVSMVQLSHPLFAYIGNYAEPETEEERIVEYAALKWMEAPGSKTFGDLSFFLDEVLSVFEIEPKSKMGQKILQISVDKIDEGTFGDELYSAYCNKCSQLFALQPSLKTIQTVIEFQAVCSECLEK